MLDIKLVKRIIEEHLTDIHSTKDLERMAAYSLETIRKAFFHSEHITLAVYIRNKRVEVAMRLLTVTDLTCQTICFIVGFSREEVGARVFKRITGMTMITHRRLSRVRIVTESMKANVSNGFAAAIQVNPILGIN